MKGVVKFYRSEKSFGFITVAGSKDVFFHKSGLSKGYMPEEDEMVEFDVVENERGKSATNVTKI